ncbi:MAG TPA: hypothetical protein VHK24_12395 [Steroidobacter sp.]|jgi:hypothetical protein|nr:hypothetical protein [Steroidobacter sp.]
MRKNPGKVIRCVAVGAAFAAAAIASAEPAGKRTAARECRCRFPAGTGTMLSVSLELLQPGTSYIGEVLAVEESGNQTITEFCFTTAN